jgi:class 3 adenylate cyclase
VLRAPLHALYRKLGRRYPRVVIGLQFQMVYLVTLGGVLLLDLFVNLSWAQFWRILLVAEVVTVIENMLDLRAAFRLIRPADRFLRGDRTPDAAVSAWRAMASLPVASFTSRRLWPLLFTTVPISVFITTELDVPVFPSVFVLIAGSLIVLSYGTFLRFFALELIARPVLEDASRALPDGAEIGRTTVPLKWRLLIALPIINIITGVVVAGFSSPDPSIHVLGVGVLVAIAVAFTISFELTLLLLRSILGPIQDLRRGTRRVAEGDYSVRVPVLGSDETGQLAGSFNQMVAGLEEREKLREAFGAFVDPVLADRVLAEGTILHGEEVEVSVLFLDIRSFTAFAERSSAREVVDRLNGFFERVVPVLAEHGGHANKFIGDGLLGVFGAPDRLPDHADRAVAAALDIAALVREVYGDELRIGIGVNSGPVVAGTIGGGGRVEFTVIGDPVNTAARVEQVTRETGDEILITEATRCLLVGEKCTFEERPTVELKGKTERVRLWAPVPVQDDLALERRGEEQPIR